MTNLKYSNFIINPIFPEVMTSEGNNLLDECPPHFHLDYDFTLVKCGVLELNLDGEIIFFSKAQISIINPGSVHYGKSVGKASLFTKNLRVGVRFVEEITKANFQHLFSSIIFPSYPIFNPFIISSFENFFDILRDSDSHPQTVLEAGWSLFKLILSLLDSHDIKNIKSKNQLVKSIEIMSSLVYTKIKVADIAKSINLSESHFIRTFKRDFGLTPYSYFMQIKLEQAFKELIKGRKAIDVAIKYGYADQAHLTRLIKKHYGYTPSNVKLIKK